MNIRSLQPTGKREWTVFGLGVVAAAVILALVTSRYEYRAMPGGDYTVPGVMRIDHWTGGMARCALSCIPVRDRDRAPAPAASN